MTMNNARGLIRRWAQPMLLIGVLLALIVGGYALAQAVGLNQKVTTIELIKTGPRGLTGATGPAGPAGKDGTNGQSIVGPRGPQGEPGVTKTIVVYETPVPTPTEKLCFNKICL